jgi:ribulose-phosphate 3-epimerase
MKKVAVSIHAVEDFTPEIINGLNNLDYIHIDVMDGKFVKSVNNNLKAFKIISENFQIPIIAHLMVIDPSEYFDKIIDYVHYFVFHIEIKEDIARLIKLIKERKKKIGLALNPDTEISKIMPYLRDIDLILIMSVYPGYSGQKFISKTIDRINSLAKYKKEYYFEIDVDGGVNLENAKKLTNADILSSSSTILNAENPNNIILALKHTV